ncbi:MAG: hypothetical protein WC455_24695 [Dehalococcoidia bacterium]|jgi:hypothetical protein
MSRTVGIPPAYLAKLDDIQRKFILMAVGLRFYDEFLCQHGKHLFIFGTTGSGKTQKGYHFVNWLKHLETQVWISSGKTNETLPLLCMDRKVRIIVPTGVDVIIEENCSGKWTRIENHPDVIPVETPRDMLNAITAGSWSKSRHLVRDTINILEVRTAFAARDKAVHWNAEMFQALAEMLREGELHDLSPSAWHIDESQWTLAGKRISNDPERMKASEIITENALELRSAGFRLVLYAQGHNNIPPPARENMIFNVICRGADVTSDEDTRLSEWCKYTRNRNPPSPMQFKTYHGRFVFENGDSYPKDRPWKFRKYPLNPEDQERIRHMRVRYLGKHDKKTEVDEILEECIPDLGRYAALAIKPEMVECAPSQSLLPRPAEIE